MGAIPLGDIARMLGCPEPERPGALVAGLASLEDAGPDDLTLAVSDRYRSRLEKSRAGAVVVEAGMRLPDGLKQQVLIVKDADLAFGRVLRMFAPPVQRPPAGIHPTAVVDPSAKIAADVIIGPHAVVGARTRVGVGSVLHSGVVVGDDVVLGTGCELFPHVVIRERCTLGDRVAIHSQTVVGSDGFGYRWDGSSHVKVPQIGTVVIGDDVEIGSNTCIDRAKFGATVVGRGTKIDNLVQIAHNVRIGENCIIVGQVGLAGSVVLGNGVVLGGKSAVRDHTALGDGASVAAASVVAGDVKPGQSVYGTPAVPRRQWFREQSALHKLPEMQTKLQELSDEVERLKALLPPAPRPTDRVAGTGDPRI